MFYRASKKLSLFQAFLAQQFLRYKARFELSRLTSHQHAKVQAIGSALHEALSNIASNEESYLISSIEQRRACLLRSKEKIAVIDYGAGSADSNRTEATMKAGVQTAKRVAEVCTYSKSTFWATILFKLIRKLEPDSCVELGSCVGISAAYLAAALNINQKGSLVTLEGSPEVAKIAQQTLKGCNLNNASVITGSFDEHLKQVLESVKPIDFFFNDGHHDHDAVLKYFHTSLPYLADDAVIIFDDISWSPGMRRAWNVIEEDERITASIDLKTVGIAFLSKKTTAKDKFRIPLL